MNSDPQSTTLAMDKTPFCQLVSREISSMQCLEMQGQEGCFGCGAPTRLCEECRMVPVDVPAVGFCSRCLVNKLRAETASTQNIEPSTSVECQIVRRIIRIEMCLATQGQEGCRNCLAPSRLCEKCKERPCQIRQYGMCLRCSVEEFGDGWDLVQAMATLPDINEISSAVQETSTTEAPVDGNSEEFLQAHIPKSLRLLARHQRLSVAFLSRRLKISETQAQIILSRCEKEGLTDRIETDEATFYEGKPE